MLGEVKCNDKDECPRVHEYKGVKYISQLFKLHDTHGFPLHMSLVECCKRGWVPCLESFIAEAITAGWSKVKALKLLAEAWDEAALLGFKPIKQEHIESLLSKEGLIR